jgi:hypothetical protein
MKRGGYVVLATIVSILQLALYVSASTYEKVLKVRRP